MSKKTGSEPVKAPYIRKYGQKSALVLMRGQPIHDGHIHLIQQAADLGVEYINILVGSARSQRRPRNPFTFGERCTMIQEAIRDHGGRLAAMLAAGCIAILPIRDMTYNNEAWLSQVQQVVYNEQQNFNDKTRPIMIGYAKDPTTDYYMKMFGPVYDTAVASPYEIDGTIIDATTIRKDLFTTDGDSLSPSFNRFVSPRVRAFITDWCRTEYKYLLGMNPIEYLRREYQSIRNYRKGWEEAMAKGLLKWEPTFNTVDAAIYCAGHVLMVERDAWPGRGLLAFPGGYVNANEHLIQAMMRELLEETCLDIPEKVLMGSLRHQRTFDDPHRSERGRLFTQMYVFQIEPNRGEMPKVYGGDDAKRAFWQPRGSLNEAQCFEDHWHMEAVCQGYLRT